MYTFNLCLNSIQYESAASFLLVINFLWAFANFGSSLGSWSWLRCSNFAFNLSGHQSERFFYVYGLLGWSLKESDIKMISKFFGLLIRNLSLILQILLVSNENSWNVFLSMLINFAHPLWHFRERFSVRDIIGDNNTVGTLVITTGDGLESLLSSGIPDLQFYSFAVHVNSSNFEINTNCWHEVVIENIILKNTNICYFHFWELNLRQILRAEMIFQHRSFQSGALWKGSRYY